MIYMGFIYVSFWKQILLYVCVYACMCFTLKRRDRSTFFYNFDTAMFEKMFCLLPKSLVGMNYCTVSFFFFFFFCTSHILEGYYL